MAKLFVSAEVLLHITSGTFRVVANPIPKDAKVVAVDVDRSQNLIILEVEHPDLDGDIVPPVIERVLDTATETD